MSGHVRDRWMSPGPNGRKVRNDRWGRGRRWQARWVDRQGVEHAKAFTSRDAADQEIARHRAGVEQPGRVQLATTFGDYAEQWRTSQLHHRESTAESVEGTFRRMLYDQLGGIPLQAVTSDDVQAAVVKWADHYAPSTVAIAYGYVATIYKRAVATGLVTKTPCFDISLPAAPKARVVPLTVDQVDAIAGSVPAWYRSMVVVGAASGLRGGELRGLTVDRFDGRVARVDRQLVKIARGGAPVFGEPKSEAGFRSVDLGEVAAAELVAHLERFPPGPHGLIWTNRRRHPVSRSDAGDVWRRATEGMQLRPRSGWHDLRHFHASLLIAAGLSPRAVADRLGHEDVAETLQTYSHLWPSDQERAVAATDAALAGLASDTA